MNGLTVNQLLHAYHVTEKTTIWIFTKDGSVEHAGYGWYSSLREYMDKEVLFFVCPNGKRIEIYLK